MCILEFIEQKIEKHNNKKMLLIPKLFGHNDPTDGSQIGKKNCRLGSGYGAVGKVRLKMTRLM